jgi:hypothetical protein
MTLIRLIFYGILAYLVIRLVGKMLGSRNSGPPRSRPVNARISTPTIRCETCGTFVAERRALVIGSHEFCSRTCAERRPI